MAKYPQTDAKERPQRQCVKCGKCEYRGPDSQLWNFQPYRYYNEKAFVNIFCSECLLSGTADELYHGFAKAHYARKYGNKFAPDKSKPNAQTPWRRKSKHPATR